MRTWIFLATVALLGIVGVASADGQTVFLNDNFNVTQSSTDMNWQLRTRQTGVLADVTYLQSVSDLSPYHELTQRNGELQLSGDGNGQPAVALDYNFNHGGPQVISFDLTPLTSNSDARVPQTSWAAITFGQSRSNALTYIAYTGGFGLLFRANGQFQPWNDTVDLGDFPYGTPPVGQFHVDIRISNADGQPFDGTPVTIQAYLNHSASPFYTAVRQTGFTDNYIGLSVNSDAGSDGRIYYAVHDFDNLQVATAPEPAAALLIPVVGALSLRRVRSSS